MAASGATSALAPEEEPCRRRNSGVSIPDSPTWCSPPSSSSSRCPAGRAPRATPSSTSFDPSFPTCGASGDAPAWAVRSPRSCWRVIPRGPRSTNGPSVAVASGAHPTRYAARDGSWATRRAASRASCTSPARRTVSHPAIRRSCSTHAARKRSSDGLFAPRIDPVVLAQALGPYATGVEEGVASSAFSFWNAPNPFVAGTTTRIVLNLPATGGRIRSSSARRCLTHQPPAPVGHQVKGRHRRVAFGLRGALEHELTARRQTERGTVAGRNGRADARP